MIWFGKSSCNGHLLFHSRKWYRPLTWICVWSVKMCPNKVILFLISRGTRLRVGYRLLRGCRRTGTGLPTSTFHVPPKISSSVPRRLTNLHGRSEPQPWHGHLALLPLPLPVSTAARPSGLALLPVGRALVLEPSLAWPWELGCEDDTAGCWDPGRRGCL